LIASGSVHAVFFDFRGLNSGPGVGDDLFVLGLLFPATDFSADWPVNAGAQEFILVRQHQNPVFIKPDSLPFGSAEAFCGRDQEGVVDSFFYNFFAVLGSFYRY